MTFYFLSSPSRAFFHPQCPHVRRQISPARPRSRSGKTKKKKKKNPLQQQRSVFGSDGDETEGNGGGGEGKAPVCSCHEETPENIVTVLAVPRHGPGGRGRELGGLPHQGGEARREQTLSFRGWAQVRSTGQVQAKGKITYLLTYLTTSVTANSFFFSLSLIRPKLTPHLSFPLSRTTYDFKHTHTHTHKPGPLRGHRGLGTVELGQARHGEGVAGHRVGHKRERQAGEPEGGRSFG